MMPRAARRCLWSDPRILTDFQSRRETALISRGCAGIVALRCRRAGVATEYIAARSASDFGTRGNIFVFVVALPCPCFVGEVLKYIPVCGVRFVGGCGQSVQFRSVRGNGAHASPAVPGQCDPRVRSGLCGLSLTVATAAVFMSYQRVRDPLTRPGAALSASSPSDVSGRCPLLCMVGAMAVRYRFVGPTALLSPRFGGNPLCHFRERPRPRQRVAHGPARPIKASPAWTRRFP